MGRNILLFSAKLCQSLFLIWVLFVGTVNVQADEPLREALKEAITRGDLENIRSELAGIDAEGEGRHLPLLHLAAVRNFDMFRMLIEDGINVYLDADPDKILNWLASVDNNLAIFLFLANKMPEAEVKAKHYQFNIFIQAINEGHVEVLDKLLRLGFDVNVQSSDGLTPLFAAAHEGNPETVEFLLENGADVNHKSMYGTPLMNAVEEEAKKVVKILLDYKADVNIQVYGGETVLWQLVRQPNPEIFGMLLKGGGDVNIRTRFGSVLLMEAARLDNIKMVEALIEIGAKIDVEDTLGETALMKAVEAGKEPVVRLLLDKGADPHKKNKVGQTMLMKAVEKKGNDGILKLLVDQGVDINAMTDLGATAMLLAMDRGIKEYEEILKKAGGK